MHPEAWVQIRVPAVSAYMHLHTARLLIYRPSAIWHPYGGNCTVLIISILQVGTHFILTATLWGRCYFYFHFYWENWGWSPSNLPTVPRIINEGAEVQTQVVQDPNKGTTLCHANVHPLCISSEKTLLDHKTKAIRTSNAMCISGEKKKNQSLKLAWSLMATIPLFIFYWQKVIYFSKEIT